MQFSLNAENESRPCLRNLELALKNYVLRCSWLWGDVSGLECQPHVCAFNQMQNMENWLLNRENKLFLKHNGHFSLFVYDEYRGRGIWFFAHTVLLVAEKHHKSLRNVTLIFVMLWVKSAMCSTTMPLVSNFKVKWLLQF